MKFVLATHNPNKIREMGAILGQFGVEVVSPKRPGDHRGRGGDREHLRGECHAEGQGHLRAGEAARHR